MDTKWNYNEYQVEEGLKSDTDKFRYFFKVNKDDEKKCNYCVWIEDEALARFDKFENFDSIISSQKNTWNRWCRKK